MTRPGVQQTMNAPEETQSRGTKLELVLRKKVLYKRELCSEGRFLFNLT